MDVGDLRVRVASSIEADVQLAVDELAAEIGRDAETWILFFASSRYPMSELAACMHEAFPHAHTVGCTTMGEIGPRGFTNGGIVAFALPGVCRAAALPIDLDSFLFHDGGRIVAELLQRVRGEPVGLSAQEHVFVTLTDGLSGKEEMLVASLGTHAPGIGLVGGSAGDDFQFERTWVALDGQVYARAAIVMLLEPGVQFRTVHMHHFRPSEVRLVVTDADPERRLIRELDGFPALDVLAVHLGTTPERLRAEPTEVLARSHVAFAFRVGSRYYLRAVMTVKDDALLMGGAVEEGSVLRLMRAGDLVETTREGMQGLLELGDARASGVLLFNCGGRMREAEARGVADALCRATCLGAAPTAGFTTYGEQYGPMQVNSTLTGLVLYDRIANHTRNGSANRGEPWRGPFGPGTLLGSGHAVAPVAAVAQVWPGCPQPHPVARFSVVVPGPLQWEAHGEREAHGEWEAHGG